MKILLNKVNSIICLETGQCFNKVTLETQCLPSKVAECINIIANGTLSNKHISSNELKQSLWPHGHISKESVTQIISRTRKQLNDTSKTILIYTPNQGYSFSGLELYEELDNNESKSELKLRTSKFKHTNKTVKRLIGLIIGGMFLLSLLFLTTTVAAKNHTSKISVDRNNKHILIDTKGEKYKCQLINHRVYITCTKHKY
ncbi:winged helix-turn-helix domain-containing protein [Vibrio maritimus]|uniref:winged helix-turn-helix domain-containing protein n=1 Tax=Vibrio maritimus TaxID=990268 RepID=UPI001F42FF76|nr:winged helix-turn-helix domain-containing protein [Vibrio maritimus]